MVRMKIQRGSSETKPKIKVRSPEWVDLVDKVTGEEKGA